MKVSYAPEATPIPEQEAPTYDPTLLPWPTVRTTAQKLDEGLRNGAQAMQDMTSLLQPMFGMLLNELTPSIVTASRPHIVRAWPFDAYQKHNLRDNGGMRKIMPAHVRSRSGTLEYNVIASIGDDGEIEIFLPMRVRPFEERTAYDTPRYSVAQNGTYRIEKSYRTVVRFDITDPVNGEKSWQEVTVYLCPTQESPDGGFAPLGDQLRIATIHAEAPEAVGEGASAGQANSSRRKAKDEPDDAPPPLTLE